MITVATLLRGNPSLTRGLLASLAANRTMFKGDLELYAGCNNEADAALVQEKAKLIVLVEKFQGTDERARIEFIADLWLQVLDGITSEHTLLWDDDLVPPASGIKRLMEVMSVAKPDVAGVVSVYPFHEDANQAVLFQGEGYFPVGMVGMPNSTFEVVGGGQGFSLWRTADLKATLPWEIHTLQGGAPYGMDYDIAQKLKAAGKRTLCDGLTRCRHIK